MNPRKNLQKRKNRRKRQITWWFSPRSETVRLKAFDTFLEKRLVALIKRNLLFISSNMEVT